jgi:hypothetical protein
MTTCLNTNTCPNDKMYDVICNFSIGINHYACNPQTTCMRADGTYDCCAKNIVSCIVDALSLREPTIQPSILISASGCNQTCNKINKCYWYESLRTDNLCVENNNEYCCSLNRADCCMTNKTGAYIVFSSIAGIIIMIIFVYYWYYVKKSHTKVVPTNEPVFV